MQFNAQAKPPVGLVIDTDMGTRPETALALALLYTLEGRNECRVVAVATSAGGLAAAAYCEVLSRFYTGTSPFGKPLPVGLKAGTASAPMFADLVNRKGPDGARVFPHGVEEMNDTAEPAAVLRNAFTAQHDQNAIALLLGPPENFLAVLALPGSKELIAAKARYLVVHNVAAAKALEPHWPTPVFCIGTTDVVFPAAAIEKEFAWSQAPHPVVEAYKAARPMPYDAGTADLAAALYAVRQGEKAFRVRGEGKLRMLEIDPSEKEALVKTYVELASAKPVPRMPRFRRPVADEPPPAKPVIKPKPQ